jgi:hypothetical protein
MQPELSIPVIWTVDGAAPLAGRLDVYGDRLHLDGGGRDSREQRDVRFDEIASARMGRENEDRIHGRAAMLLQLRDGGTVSLAGFDRPGALSELLHRIEDRI